MICNVALHTSQFTVFSVHTIGSEKYNPKKPEQKKCERAKRERVYVEIVAAF